MGIPGDGFLSRRPNGRVIHANILQRVAHDPHPTKLTSGFGEAHSQRLPANAFAGLDKERSPPIGVGRGGSRGAPGSKEIVAKAFGETLCARCRRWAARPSTMMASRIGASVVKHPDVRRLPRDG